MKEWTVVYKSHISSRTEIVKGVLTDRGFDVVIVNKKDSTIHIDHGLIEVQVKKSDALEAMKIINDEISFD
jgi:hypothetical protein